jgi:hypothetical protein
MVAHNINHRARASIKPSSSSSSSPSSSRLRDTCDGGGSPLLLLLLPLLLLALHPCYELLLWEIRLLWGIAIAELLSLSCRLLRWCVCLHVRVATSRCCCCCCLHAACRKRSGALPCETLLWRRL